MLLLTPKQVEKTFSLPLFFQIYSLLRPASQRLSDSFRPQTDARFKRYLLCSLIATIFRELVIQIVISRFPFISRGWYGKLLFKTALTQFHSHNLELPVVLLSDC